MRKTTRFLAFFCVLALLFSAFFVVSSSENDERFDSYLNMGENAKLNNYDVPNLFRQDGVYSNISRFPLVVKNGVEYVPLSVFILYPYVEVNYSKTDDNFFLVNSRNNHYISFNVAAGVASTHDGDLLKMSVPIFNKTKYVPARTVAVVLGFSCETYDDPQNGFYAFRVSDGKSSKTLAQLVSPYIEQKLESLKPPPPPVVEKPVDDPLKDLAKRKISICYAGISSDSVRQILDTLTAYRIKASFSVTREDILERTSLVREIYVSGHSLLVTAGAFGETAGEYAKSFVEGLESANEALSFVMKKRTRMCVLPYGLPEEIKNDRDFVSAVEGAGYIILEPNTDTGDAPDYTGSAYSVSAKIKNKITSGFDEDREATVTALVWCSEKTPYYTTDVVNLVNKYPQHKFYAMDESVLYKSRGER